MRILIHGINFSRKLTGIGKYTGEMAEWLAAQGYQVRVVTEPPYYPQWKVAEGYSGWRYRREGRVLVCRAALAKTPLSPAPLPLSGRGDVLLDCRVGCASSQ